ncbi:hypothetical protein VHE8714_04818 [Vibrio splendidus]|nr:hypothetical protein VHE8714_04818 [Vibrio splendidus]
MESGVNVLSGLSTSVLVNVPEVVTALSVSSTLTVAVLTVATSLVPLIVTLMVEDVPSTDDTVKVSSTLSPTFNWLNALLAVNVQCPLASIVRSPLDPVIESGVKVLSGLSTSVLVSVPDVVTALSVSSMATVALLTVAASLVPLIVTLMVDGVPSTDETVKVSSTLSPTFN